MPGRRLSGRHMLADANGGRWAAAGVESSLIVSRVLLRQNQSCCAGTAFPLTPNGTVLPFLPTERQLLRSENFGSSSGLGSSELERMD